MFGVVMACSAVITVLLVTTYLTSLAIIICWHKSIMLAIFFLLFFGSIEALNFSTSLIKFLEGDQVPMLLVLIFMTIMYVWHYGTIKKYDFDLENKVSIKWLLGLGPSLGIVQVPGIGHVHKTCLWDTWQFYTFCNKSSSIPSGACLYMH